eukprot:PhM_4_TR9583/c0_g1_i1/m.3829
MPAKAKPTAKTSKPSSSSNTSSSPRVTKQTSKTVAQDIDENNKNKNNGPTETTTTTTTHPKLLDLLKHVMSLPPRSVRRRRCGRCSLSTVAWPFCGHDGHKHTLADAQQT